VERNEKKRVGGHFLLPMQEMGVKTQNGASSPSLSLVLSES
jgi:hypothetical protein